MNKFIIILVSTFISFTAALATWDFAKSYLIAQEAARLMELAEAESDKADEEEQASEDAVSRLIDSWQTEVKKNPVTGAIAMTASRLAEEPGGGITFRCYGRVDKRFDVLISFPKDVSWFSYKGKTTREMMFRLDEGELATMVLIRNSPAVGVPILEAEETYGLETIERTNSGAKTFKNITSSTLFEASIQDGTIYDQTMRINLTGIKEAVQPVLDLCNKDSI
ncbi:hypothetical protein ACFL3Y_01145 [Pseudomonadota bacterium]